MNHSRKYGYSGLEKKFFTAVSMAKVVESSSEPSQSSTALPPLADNEVELVIDRFWRDTRPRVCVRSETKMVNGFNFRLLVWPQGSKQSQSHLSAFVEVVPPSGKDSAYPLDWACPCVFYRISVMNFKQKYPYSKADTWTFSYVCSDRGWHTLLDTRYINRRDGYLSNDGSLVIRAIAFPRFAHSINVLPLLNSVVHTEESSPSSSRPPQFGLSNFLATDHLNCLIQSLFHLPGFRKFIYLAGDISAKRLVFLDPASIASIQSGLDSCIDTIKEIMDRIVASSVDVSRLIISDFHRDVSSSYLPKGSDAVSVLIRKYAKCRVLINCIEEALFCVSSSLGRKRIEFVVNHKRTQLEAYQQIVKDCRRILTSVSHSLFLAEESDQPASSLIVELQLVFAQLEFAADQTLVPAFVGKKIPNALIDTRGIIRELGMSNGGICSNVTPDGLYLVFFDALRKAFRGRPELEKQLAEFVQGVAHADETYTFTQVRFSSPRCTSIEKHLNCWAGLDTSEPVGGGGSTVHTKEEGVCESSSGSLPESNSTRFSEISKILNFQFLNRVKDRMDIPERIDLAPYMDRKHEVEEEDDEEDDFEFSWEKFLTEDVFPACQTVQKTVAPSSMFRLHSLLFCSGDLATGHYSVMVRNNRAGGWTRFDDAWKEEMIDAFDGGGQEGRPDWVFSAEWSVAGATYVREDAVDEMYFRGVDVRLLNREVFQTAVNLLIQRLDVLPLTSPLVCNKRVVPPNPPSSVDVDAAHQVEVCLITEKALLAAAPGGFSTPFSLSFPSVPRKLIVRRDIPVSRLMKAVADHFKIPAEMQRLFALRYFAETCQERFELMTPQRSISAYSPEKSAKLYVLVSAARAQVGVVTVWIKILDEQQKAILSVCLLTMETNKSLKEYFEQVAEKSGIAEKSFLVFEEVGPRTVHPKRTVGAMENVLDGDILIFVPLTDVAKRSLSTVGVGLPKRQGSADPLATLAAAISKIPPPAPQVAERCRRFLSQVEEEEDLMEMIEEECFCCECDNKSDESMVRKLLKAKQQSKPSERLHEVMNDIIKEFEEGGLEFSNQGEEESEKYFSKLMAGCLNEGKRLDLPSEIRDEISRIPCPMCFYCRLPITNSRSSAPARVGCSRRCVGHALQYHERCVQDLIRENSGSDACIITENCPGRLLVEPKTLHRNKPIFSSAILRTKVAEVLPMPLVPVLNKAGLAVVKDEVVVFKPSKKLLLLPAIPAMKKSAKKNALPLESLWWNACLVAFGDNLSLVVVDKQWDAADLALAKHVFVNWCKTLLEKKSKTNAKGETKPELKVDTKVELKVEQKSDPKVDQTKSDMKVNETVKSAKSIKSGVNDINSTVNNTAVKSDIKVIDVKSADLKTNHAKSAVTNLAAKSGMKSNDVKPSAKSAVNPTVKPNLKVSDVKSAVAAKPDIKAVDLKSDLAEDAKTVADIYVGDYYVSDSDGSDDTWEAVVSKKDKKVVTSTPTSATTTPTAAEQIVTPTIKTSMTEVSKTSVPVVLRQEVSAPPGLAFDASIVAERAVSSILLDFEETANPVVPVVEIMPKVENARMALLPANIRSYCLPMDIVFVYYSAEYFRSHAVLRDTKPVTVSLITKAGEECMHAIHTAAFNNSCAIVRLFASPNQGGSVQWFAEFHSIEHCEKFFLWTQSNRPEWTPETGALLGASLLGFAV